MKKATLKTYLITLLVLLLSFALMLTAFACNKTEEQTEEETKTETTEFTSLVSNGDFSSFSEGTQPYSPKNWSSYNPNSTSSDNVVAGVIDTGASYANVSSAWGNLANPFGEVKDEKLLMIYNKEAIAYGYTNTFSAEAYGYYKVSAKVKVVNADPTNGGATFRVSSDNGFASFSDINSTDSFTTYTFYIEASSVNSLTITVTLSLGYKGSNVKGYAFFDDVIAEKITLADYTAAENAESNPTTKLVSMLYPDGEFSYYTDSDLLHSPVGWSFKTGEKINDKSLSSAYTKHGIISTVDTDLWTDKAEEYGANPNLPEEESTDKNVLMIAANKNDNEDAPTAVYYQTDNKIRIDISTLYEISVWVKASFDPSDDKKGARVVLKGTDKYESAIINTTDKGEVNGGWAKVTFYILGNPYRNTDFNIQLWLGYDDSTASLAQGKVFFDKLTIKKGETIAENERATTKTTYEEKEGSFETDVVTYVKFISLDGKDNMITNGNFDDDLTGYELKPTSESVVVDTEKDVIATVISVADLAKAEWGETEKAAYGIAKNPLYPYTFAPVLIVNNKIPTAYSVEMTDNLEIKQSTYYRLSVWIKTVDLESGKNVTLKIVDKDGESVESFSVNTESYTNETTNDYAEYIFYLKGALPVNEIEPTNSNFVRVVVSNGSGTNYDPSSFQKGAFLIANINMEEITDEEYNNASSGSYVVKKDYASNSATVTNGNFNSYDMSETVFDDNKSGFVALKDKDGNTNLTAGISSWTNNVDERYGTVKLFVEGKTATLTKTIDKTAENNTANSFTVDLSGKKVTTVTFFQTGAEETTKKVLNSSSEWNKYFSIDQIANKVKWASGSTVTDLENGEYTVRITTDEKIVNKLIAGIINANTTVEGYLAQFGLTKAMIYANDENNDDWSTTTDLEFLENTKELVDVDFGAPNLLMIAARYDEENETRDKIALKNTYVDEKATNDMTKTAAIKSPSFSLSGSSYYLLQCYAKALYGAEGQIFVTTTSTDTEVSSLSVKNTNGWVEYNFLVETGLSSVSAQFEIYFGVRDDGQEGYDGDKEYSGILLFDSFSYTTITEDEYKAKTEENAKGLFTDKTPRSKFTTVTFDNTSANDKAVTPSGFSASNSSNSNSDTQVSGIIKKDTFHYTDDNDKNVLGIYETVTTTDESGNETSEEKLAEGSSLSQSDIFTDAGMQGNDTVGDYLLMVNNRKATYQSYYLSSLSLSSDAYYMFSAYVRTAKIEKDKYANVYVTISDDTFRFDVNTEYDKDGNKKDANEWQKFTFYFNNTKSSSVSASIYFRLGENNDDGKLKGYLFVDNVSLSKITKTEYENATTDYEKYEQEGGVDKLDADGNKILTEASKTFRLANKVVVLEDEETTDEEDEEEDEDTESSSNWSNALLWTYITSIAIAVVLIAVIAVWLIKKYRRPKKSGIGAKKAGYDRTNVSSGSAEEDTSSNTGSARDEYKD